MKFVVKLTVKEVTEGDKIRERLVVVDAEDIQQVLPKIRLPFFTQSIHIDTVDEVIS